MHSRESTQTTPDAIPDDLVTALDALERPALRAVRTYVEQQLAARCTPIAEQIAAEADGDVVDVEDCGAYTLVRKRPPNQGGPDAGSRPVHVYHVTRGKRPDGGDTLHWSFMGEARESAVSECRSCGTSLDERTEVCPHCASEHPLGEDS